MILATVNYWAVIVAGLVYVGIGMLWYGPLFGTMWKKMMGFTDKEMKKMRLTPAQAMFMGLLTALVMSYVLAHFIDYFGAVDLGTAFAGAFWIWLGFFATTQMGAFLWEGKPFKLYILNTTHSLVSLIIMVWILAVWP